MAGKIKGITIEIGGNTQPLEKALGDVNKKTRDLQGELKSVERLLKLDPTNTELLAQKQKLLGEQVDNSREKLNRLKAAQEQVNQAYQRGDIGEEQYRHFSRQVINAEQDLRKFEGQLREISSTAKKTGLDVKDIGDKLKGAGQGMSAAITVPVVGGFAAVTEGTRDLRMDMGKLEAAFTTAGFTAKQAKDVYFDFYGILGESDTAIEAVNHLAQMTKSQEELANWTTIATGVYATFGDSLPIEGLTEAANETAKVGLVTGPLADALNWAGISEDEFNKKLAACNSEQERQDLIMQTLLGTYDKAAAKYREVNAEVIKANEANARLKDSFAILGGTLEPILTPIIEAVTNLVNKFNEMDPAGQKIILVIATIAAAIGPLLIVIGALTTAAAGLGLGIGALVGIIAGVIVAIGLLVAAGITIYKNWDEIKAKAIEIWGAIKDFFTQTWGSISQTASNTWNGMKSILSGFWNDIKNTASSVWENIKTVITNPIESAKQTILNIIQTIKTAFANMRITIPTPKLPHISVSSKTKKIGGISVPYPDFNLNWYKTGGIFATPSVIGVGEAGTEVVAPLDKLPGLIARALREAIGTNPGSSNFGFDKPIQLVVNLDGRVIAQNLYNLQQTTARGRGIK